MPNQDSELVCIFCGNARAGILYELPHVWHQPPDSGKIVVRWCDDCAVGFVAPLPSESRLAEFYGSSYFDTYGTKLHGKPPAGVIALAWRMVTHLAWRLDRSCPVTPEFLSRFAPRGSSVCDLGCGPGHLLKALRAYGYQACGIEPDPAAVKLCVDQEMEVHVGTAEALPQNLAGRRFDAVVMTQVLEHCRDPRSALRGALGLLRSGGHLIVEVPNAGSRAARESGAAWFHADVGRHLYFFTPKSLAAVARQAGAEIVETVFSEYTAQFLPDRLTAEQQVWDALHQSGARVLGRDTKRPSATRRGILLAETALAAVEHRYGVVALVARVA
jgi:methionine biosynthesis protein MetW